MDLRTAALPESRHPCSLLQLSAEDICKKRDRRKENKIDVGESGEHILSYQIDTRANTHLLVLLRDADVAQEQHGEGVFLAVDHAPFQEA